MKPEALKFADDVIRHFKNSMGRNGLITRSMEDMLGGMLSHWSRERMACNGTVTPGIAKMAKWGRCSERTAQRNFRQLLAWGVVQPQGDTHGGRSKAVAFTVDMVALCRHFVALGARMSRALVEKMKAFGEAFGLPVKGDKKGDTMSPAIEELPDSVPPEPSEILTKGLVSTEKPTPGPLSRRLMASVWGSAVPNFARKAPKPRFQSHFLDRGAWS